MTNQTFDALHVGIKGTLEGARSKARSGVNVAMVEAYWLIGQRSVREEQLAQQKAQHGTRLHEELSIVLTADFGNGFSYANFYHCRQFYRVFPDQEILYTMCRDLIGGRSDDKNPADGQDETSP